MADYIDNSKIASIFKLNLESKLICDEKKAFPIIVKGRADKDSFMAMIETGSDDIRSFSKCEIELKGSIDIEYLRYRGRVDVVPIFEQPGYYRLENIRLKRVDGRSYKRVPYRREITITNPIQSKEVLINLSASGALIYSRKEIPGNALSFEFILLKKALKLEARIVEQYYDERNAVHVIRCQFDNIDKRNKKIIQLAVRAITLEAKKRLQNM